MPLVESVDYPNKRIFLSADTIGVAVLPIDIYTEMRERRRLNADNDRKFFPMVTAFGNEPAGPTNTPRFTDLAADVRLVPFNSQHTLNIRGLLISREDGLAGTQLFDRSTLTEKVNIDYQPPQVEIITVSSGSGLSTEQDTKLTNIEALLSDVEGGLDVDAILRIILAATAGKGGSTGSNEFRYRDLADTKDRIVADTDGQGTRTNITLDPS